MNRRQYFNYLRACDNLTKEMIEFLESKTCRTFYTDMETNKQHLNFLDKEEKVLCIIEVDWSYDETVKLIEFNMEVA